MIKFEKLPPGTLARIPAAAQVLADDDVVVFAYLFGGLASGDSRPLSDVDLAVYTHEVADPGAHKLALFDRLTDALGTAELDLVVLNRAPTSLAGRILQHRKVLVDKDPFRRHAYESQTLRQFFDFRFKEDAILARRYGIGR